MSLIIILFIGVLFWIIGFKTFKGKAFMKIIEASILSLEVVTLGLCRFNYTSWNTGFILIILYLIVYIVIKLASKIMNNSNKLI